MKRFALVLFLSLILSAGLFLSQKTRFEDGKLHIIFCDVGQGDAIMIKTPHGSTIVVDGGPNDRLLSCISNHLPFWRRSIDLVILTHPHQDHLAGLISLVQAYQIKTFLEEPIKNTTQGYKTLKNELARAHVPQKTVVAGDRIKTPEGVVFRIVGPLRSFLEQTSPGGLIGENKEFGSVETLVSFGSFRALLTGDSQSDELVFAVSNIGSIDLLQVPHHGSRTGLTQGVLDILNPALAVISVGAHNRYQHPSPQILELLRNGHIKTLRTDQAGDIEIVSDGKGSVKETFVPRPSSDSKNTFPP